MNMNQMHSQLEYQTDLLNQGPQQNQILPDHSSVFGYQSYTQPSQSNVLYNLNFNHHMDQLQPYDTSGSTINANTIYHHSELNHNQHENTISSSPSAAENKNHRAAGKANSNGMGLKRQKKMKLNNDLDGQQDLLDQSNPNYLYQNTNYYHKQSLIGSSSITSSNSSSTSSSPLSSTSPSHHQTHHNQLTQMGMNISGYHASAKQSGLGQTHFSATGVVYPVHNQLFGYMDDMDTLKQQQQQQDSSVNNGTGYDVMMDTNNSSIEEFSQRAKLKKSKRDPISEYDSELAESIEFELGLKKQNGPRKNSWGNLSYAELITRAIESSSDQRLTLSQIYDWIVKYVPYFKEKFDRTSSAGWKNSIRHNLSLHNRFIRVQNESSGKSSWWMINPDMSKYSLNPQITAGLMGHVSGMMGSSSENDTTEHGPDQENNNNNINLSSQEQSTFTTLNSLETIGHEENMNLADLKAAETSVTDPLLKAANRTLKSKSNKSPLSRQKSSKLKQANKTTPASIDSKSHSPSSPASTSSLKENDLLSNNNSSVNQSLTSSGSGVVESSGANHKLSQNTTNLVYFDLNNSTSQQGNLMDSGPLTMSNNSNIPYSVGVDSANSNNNNSILRAALQKSNATGPNSSAPAMPASSYYNSYPGNGSYVSQVFTYPNYSNSYTNQSIFGISPSTPSAQSGYNNEGYFSSSASLTKMPMTPASTPSATSPSSTTSSSNSTSSTTSTTIPNQRQQQQQQTHNLYPNYYGQVAPSLNQLGSSQIYQNTIFNNKNSNHQYPSSYSSSTYYDATNNRTIQSSDDNNNLNTTRSTSSHESSDTSSSTTTPGMLASSYEELTGFQEVAMKPIGCYYS